MELTILGSGGCMTIPKPLCKCPVCEEARAKGIPYERGGPSAFIGDENILIDTPAEISLQLNRSQIKQVDNLLFTHLDPDHVEGFRVVEKISLDFRTWKAYPDKNINLVLPLQLDEQIRKVQSIYGPLINFYEKQGFVKRTVFRKNIELGDIHITAIPVPRNSHISFIYVFKKNERKLVYAPCDIKPFPEDRDEVQKADILAIQPGIFEDGLKHEFIYPENHISRTTLYTFEDTVELAKRIMAKKVLFIHIEEYWNRSYDEYLALQSKFENIQFAYDGMKMAI
jgi:phosphoribosyl 1,2-cyclic phosphate phosphodiesterase